MIVGFIKFWSNYWQFTLKINQFDQKRFFHYKGRRSGGTSGRHSHGSASSGRRRVWRGRHVVPFRRDLGAIGYHEWVSENLQHLYLNKFNQFLICNFFHPYSNYICHLLHHIFIKFHIVYVQNSRSKHVKNKLLSESGPYSGRAWGLDRVERKCCGLCLWKD